MGPGRLPLAGCAAQGMQERPLPDGIAVSVLGQQPCRPGALLTDQRPPRPAAGAENFRKPPRVFLTHKPVTATDTELAGSPAHRFLPPSARDRLRRLHRQTPLTLVMSGHAHQYRLPDGIAQLTVGTDIPDLYHR